MECAYAPYSEFPVGVAALVDDGRVVTGCNVENAAYGVALCAECGMVSAAARSPAAAGWWPSPASTRDGDSLMPCGRCRQLLWENGGARLLGDDAAGGPHDERDRCRRPSARDDLDDRRLTRDAPRRTGAA